MPFSEHVASRPLQFNVTLGQYTHVLRVTKAGVIARHRHSGGVHAWVFKGRWHYLEHDWVAEEGSYIFEPPGETHTLVVPEGCTEMVTLFQVNGSLIYVDPQGVGTATTMCSPASRGHGRTTPRSDSAKTMWTDSYFSR